MILALAACRRSVMATLAITGNPGVAKISWLPGKSGMANITVLVSYKMIF
jgi:hypothetical protein